MVDAALSIAPAGTAGSNVLPETRGYYLSHARPFDRASLEREMELAALAGFNLVLLPVYVNGYTLFPSETARAAGFAAINPLFKKRDPLAEALEIAHGFRMSLWGFVRPYNFHDRYKVAGHRLLQKFPHWRVAIHSALENSDLRRREQYVACPANPDYRRYLGDLLAEMITGYPVDGLVLNYTGFGFRDGSLEREPYCFCPSCRSLFAEEHRANLERKAQDPEGLALVRKWQTEVSTRSLEYFRHRVIKSRRTLRVVCRAQPQWRWNSVEAGPALHAPYCIDWNGLLGSGVVEELIIDHDEDIVPELFSSRLVSDMAELHHEALLVPSIEVKRPSDLEAPLAAVRKYPVPGFLAQFAGPLTGEEAETIREHYLSEPAQLPERHPLAAVTYLLERVRARHDDNPLIRDFMRDFLRLIERAHRQGAEFGELEVIFENLAGLRDALRRGRLGDYPVPESTHRDIGLARRLVRLASTDVRT